MVDVTGLRGLPGTLVAKVVPPALEDAFGDPVADPSRFWFIEGCHLAPEASRGQWSSSVGHDRTATTDTTWTVYAPAGAVFPRDATVEIGGVVGGVMGDVQDWGDAGVVVRIRRVIG